MKKILALCVLGIGMQAIAMEKTDDKVNISGLDKKVLLKALHSRSKPLSEGFFLHSSAELSDKDAEDLSKGYLKGLRGRVMEIDISGDTVDTRLYNRANGPNAAEEVIQRLRQTQ